MTRQEIITELKNYFSIRDLVCDHVFNNFGERAWQFLDTELLHTILVVRIDILKTPMFVNYPNSGRDERGLRCNLCSIVMQKTKQKKSYLSAHVNGAGVDFDAKGLTAEQTRQKIKDNKDLLPYPIRLEKNVSWVHIDIYDYCNGQIINEFEG